MDEKQKFHNISRHVKTVRVDGKNKTLPIKTFGSDKFICETYHVTDAKAWAKEQVRLMNEQRRFNGGYLFLQDIYYELGLHKISAPT